MIIKKEFLLNIMTLTEQELEAAYLAKYDLGPGYPQMKVPDYIRKLYLDDTIEEKSLYFPPVWSTEKQIQIDEDLRSSLINFISPSNNKYYDVYSTFSGSIALDRALASVQIIAKEKRKKNIRVVTTTPCIDIMKLFLSERADIFTSFIPSRKDGVFGSIDEQAIIEELCRLPTLYPSDQLCVLICSPENPTGQTWSAKQMASLVTICAELEAILIVDHCFLLAGVHSHNDIVKIWDVARSDLMWIGVWDTGKTFGLNEDKLGFLITSSEVTTRSIKQAVSVLQFGVSRRSKLFFTDLLRSPNSKSHVEQLRNCCNDNLQSLINSSNKQFFVEPTVAGSLALIDIRGTGKSDEAIRRTLLDNGVGVIAGNVFFHTDWKETNFIRVALARNPRYFDEAIDRLLSCLS